ncbi:MAG TPA: DUF432 domain-containing protein [Pyrodictium sp.]|nr:DUF432 domain-containing protein [Pyrodictium sp.]
MTELVGYGLLEPGSRRRIANYVYEYLVGENMSIVRRLRGEEVETSINVVATFKTRLYVVPAPPILIPQKFTNYIMLRLSKPLAVFPKTSRSLYTVLRVNVALVAASNGQNLVLDAISLGKQRYALYGQPDRGLIAAYQFVRLLDYRPACDWQAVLNIRVVNNIGSPVKLERIVVPAYLVKFYYCGAKVVTSPVKVTIVSRDVAQVEGVKWQPPKGYVEAPRLATAPSLATRFLMEYGL